MPNLKSKLYNLKSNFDEIAKNLKPSDYFGNTNLIHLTKNIEDLQKQIDEKVECKDCDGLGIVYHNCSCYHCNGSYTCPNCDGDGLIEKTC